MLFVYDNSGTGCASPRMPFQRSGILARCFCVCLLALVGNGVTAQSDVTDGRFFVDSAFTSTNDDVLYLTAFVSFNLSAGALQALDSGVPLVFETQIELNRMRRFLPDPNVVKLVQRSQLTYHALTERFVVINLNSSAQASFTTLSDALANIGEHKDLPVIDVSLLDRNRSYVMGVRSVLDTRSVPTPLRVLAALFRVDDWRLESDWQRWLVRL